MLSYTESMNHAASLKILAER